jgi:hypothetical protein
MMLAMDYNGEESFMVLMVTVVTPVEEAAGIRSDAHGQFSLARIACFCRHRH